MTFHNTYKGMATSPLNTPLKDEDAREIEKLLDTGEYSPFRHFVAKSEGFFPGERSDISVISDDSVDSDKEVFVPNTLKFDRFQKNPIVAYGHNYKIAPIGRSLWQKQINGQWKAKTQYASKPSDYPVDKEWFPDSIFHMVKEGFLPGKSIGGVAKFREPTAEDFTKNVHWTGAKRITTDVQVFEYSVVSLQSNKNAIVQAVAKGLVFFPDEVLSDFPELEDFIKSKKDLPVITDFVTKEQYLAELESQQFDRIKHLQEEIPQMIKDKLDVMMGIV